MCNVPPWIRNLSASLIHTLIHVIDGLAKMKMRRCLIGYFRFIVSRLSFEYLLRMLLFSRVTYRDLDRICIDVLLLNRYRSISRIFKFFLPGHLFVRPEQAKQVISTYLKHFYRIAFCQNPYGHVQMLTFTIWFSS